MDNPPEDVKEKAEEPVKVKKTKGTKSKARKSISEAAQDKPVEENVDKKPSTESEKVEPPIADPEIPVKVDTELKPEEVKETKRKSSKKSSKKTADGQQEEPSKSRKSSVVAIEVSDDKPITEATEDKPIPEVSEDKPIPEASPESDIERKKSVPNEQTSTSRKSSGADLIESKDIAESAPETLITETEQSDEIKEVSLTDSKNINEDNVVDGEEIEQSGDLIPTENFGEQEGSIENAEETTPETAEDEAMEETESPEGMEVEDIMEEDVFNTISENLFKELEEAFELFDFNRDGMITHQDLQKLFKSIDIIVPDRDITAMLAEGSKPLDFEGFVKMIGRRAIELDDEEILTEALSKWDYDQSGCILLTRFVTDMMALGERFTNQEMRWALEMATIFKKDGKKYIEYPEFCQILGGMRKKGSSK